MGSSGSLRQKNSWVMRLSCRRAWPTSIMDCPALGIQLFSNKRQQTGSEIEGRHQIVRQAFFEYAGAKGISLKTKDDRRAFSESERIRIYRRDNGRCQHCVAEGKPDRECIVPWSEYDADHVLPHSRGGQTILDNAQLLCGYHNKKKGATAAE